MSHSLKDLQTNRKRSPDGHNCTVLGILEMEKSSGGGGGRALLVFVLGRTQKDTTELLCGSLTQKNKTKNEPGCWRHTPFARRASWTKLRWPRPSQTTAIPFPRCAARCARRGRFSVRQGSMRRSLDFCLVGSSTFNLVEMCFFLHPPPPKQNRKLQHQRAIVSKEWGAIIRNILRCMFVGTLYESRA